LPRAFQTLPPGPLNTEHRTLNRVNLHIIIRGVTFEDSTLDKVLNTSSFTYDAASGKWLYAYRMIATPDLFTGTCHSIIVYQGSDQVGQ